MNRMEALQAAIDIAGPNVTAEEHIQYAEFLLGEHVTYVDNYITGEDTQSICDVESGGMSTWQIVDGREYTPHEFIGQPVRSGNWKEYPKGAFAIDHQADVWHHEGQGVWSLYEANVPWNPEQFTTATVEYWGGVFVA